MAKNDGKFFEGYAQDGMPPLTSMLPQTGTRGTPPLSSTLPKAPAVPVASAPVAPVGKTSGN